MEKGNTFLFILFGFAAMVTWWLNNQQENTEVLSKEKPTHTPAFFLEHLITTEMNELGTPVRQLKAQKMTNYIDDNSSVYRQPRLIIIEEGKPPWRIRSSSATQSGDGKFIHLHGKVNIDRASSHDTKPVHMITRNMVVDRINKTAITDENVLSISLKDRVDAVGMKAWLEAPVKIKLKSRVRGRHDISEKN